jgi:sulfite exporter TauE/SafE
VEATVHWGVWSPALLLGLVGSLHCAGMCGPLVLVLPARGWTPQGWVASRIVYQLGRVTTYAGLGCVFGLVGRTLVSAGVQGWVSLGLGGLLLFGVVWRWSGIWIRGGWITPGWLARGMHELLAERSWPAMYALGVLNGFLPCGLVYVAGAAATASGSLIHAILFMLGFGLGTVPMMLLLSLAPQKIPVSWRIRGQRLVPWTVALVAVLLILRGLSLGIPYLSPNLGNGAAAPCCH